MIIKKILFASALTVAIVSCNNMKQKSAATITETKQETNTIKTENSMKTIHLTRADFMEKVANLEENPPINGFILETNLVSSTSMQTGAGHAK